MPSKYPILNDKSWLQQKYTEERLSTNQIAELVKCGPYAVLTALRRSEIHVRSYSESHMAENASGYALLNNEVWLRQKYEKEGLTTYQIGEVVKCTGRTVAAALRRCKIHVRSSSEARESKYATLYPLLRDKEWLLERYKIERLTTYQIGSLLGCAPATVAASLRNCDIGVRTNSESQKGRVFTEETRRKMSAVQSGEKSHMYGRKVSEETRRKISTARKGTKSSEATKEKLRGYRRKQRFQKHHTKPELRFEAICTKNNLPFVFTGNSKVWIGRNGEPSINPDFIGKSNGKKFAVFVNGDFWHSQLLRPQLGETQRPEFQISHSKKHRWVPIILWETDLKRDDSEAFVLSTLKKEGFDVPNIEQQQNAK